MNSTRWTDKKNWLMGIVASLIIFAVTAIGTLLVSKVGRNKEITPFPNGVDLLSTPQLRNVSTGRIEAIHKPKGHKNVTYRYYDVYLANPTDKPLMLVSVIIDTTLMIGSGHTSSDGNPVFPNITYELKYDPLKIGQMHPLQKPFRIKPKGIGALRLHLVPIGSVQSLENSLKMNLTILDSLGGKYCIIQEFQ